jgi:cell division protein FtsB
MKRFRKVSWLFGISFTLLVIFLPGYTKVQELRDRNRQLEADIGKIRRENRALAEQIQRIENDPFYQEKIVREKMGVVRKGEVPYKFTPAE